MTQRDRVLAQPAGIPTGPALREHMLTAHREPPEDDKRRNETSEENRHYWLHYGSTGRSDHDHQTTAAPAPTVSEPTAPTAAHDHRGMTQKDRVLDLLRRAKLRGLCAETLYRNALPNGRNRISELRRAGWCIRSFPCPDEHGPGYFKYVLLHPRGRTCGACRPAQATLFEVAS